MRHINGVQYLTAKEAAKERNVHLSNIYRLIGRGTIPAILEDGQYLIKANDVHRRQRKEKEA